MFVYAYYTILILNALGHTIYNISYLTTMWQNAQSLQKVHYAVDAAHLVASHVADILRLGLRLGLFRFLIGKSWLRGDLVEVASRWRRDLW